MPSYGESTVVHYYAWDTNANAYKTGDSANHTIHWMKDGVLVTPSQAVSESNAPYVPGLYQLTLLITETNAVSGFVAGKSATANISIIGYPYTFERLPTALADGRMPADVKLWKASTPSNLVDGRVAVDLATWRASTPDNLTSSNVPANVVMWVGAAPDALSSGKVASDLKLWLAGTPRALSDASVPVDVKLWKASTPSNLVDGRVSTDLATWRASTPDNLVNAGVPVNSNLKKNQPRTAFEFLVTDNVNHAPVTLKTPSATRSIDGGAFAAGTLSAVTEIANGIYSVDFGAADLNGNVIVLRVTAVASDDTFERIVTVP